MALRLLATCSLLFALVVPGSLAQSTFPPTPRPFFDGMVADFNAAQPKANYSVIDRWFTGHETGVIVCNQDNTGVTEARLANDTNSAIMKSQIIELMLLNATVYKSWKLTREVTALSGSTPNTSYSDALVRWRVDARTVLNNTPVTRRLFTKHNPWGCNITCFDSWRVSFICGSVSTPLPGRTLYGPGVGGNRRPFYKPNSTVLALDSSPNAYMQSVIKNMESAMKTQNETRFRRQFAPYEKFRASKWVVNSTFAGPTDFIVSSALYLNNNFSLLEFNYNYKKLGYVDMSLEIVDHLQMTRVQFDSFALVKQTLFPNPAVLNTTKPAVVMFLVKFWNDARCGQAPGAPDYVPAARCQSTEVTSWGVVTHLCLTGAVQTFV